MCTCNQLEKIAKIRKVKKCESSETTDVYYPTKINMKNVRGISCARNKCVLLHNSFSQNIYENYCNTNCVSFLKYRCCQSKKAGAVQVGSIRWADLNYRDRMFEFDIRVLIKSGSNFLVQFTWVQMMRKCKNLKKMFKDPFLGPSKIVKWLFIHLSKNIENFLTM